MYKNYKYGIAVIYTIVLFLDRLDLTIVNTTLPTLSKYFDVSIVQTDWISLSFLLALAVSIPMSAWLGERFGHKRIYILAMLFFGLGSTLCIFANSLNQLILLRFLQGLGGGLLIPVGMSIIYNLYDKSEYASITSFTFLPSLLAPAIAPFLGGILLDSFGWRLVFACTGPISLVLAFVSAFLIKEDLHRSRTPFDWMGFFIGEIILLDSFYGLSKLGKEGFTTIVIMMLLVLFPLVCLFIKVENRKAHPLVQLNFFKNPQFLNANLIQICFQACHFGAIFLIGLFLQAGVGFSATLAGLMMGMQAIGAMLTSRLSVKFYNQFGPKMPIMIGLAGVALISPMIMLINQRSLLMWGIIIFLVRGIFSGLCGTPIQTLSVVGFEKEEIGAASSIFNTCRQVAISLGVTISSLLIAFGLHKTGLTGTENIMANQIYSVFVYGFFVIPVIAVIGIFIMNRYEQASIQ